jgi:hypothetical protein
MKHNNLRSIAHNIADSLASGVGLPIGAYSTDIFGEAATASQGFITVDFLNGTTEGGTPSTSLAEAIKLYSDLLPSLCEKQHSQVEFFKSLKARYSGDALDRYVSITIEDKSGRTSTDNFTGSPLRHVKVLDNLGRIRKARN